MQKYSNLETLFDSHNSPIKITNYFAKHKTYDVINLRTDKTYRLNEDEIKTEPTNLPLGTCKFAINDIVINLINNIVYTVENIEMNDNQYVDNISFKNYHLRTIHRPYDFMFESFDNLKHF